jgi:hypothetical protein
MAQLIIRWSHTAESLDWSMYPSPSSFIATVQTVGLSGEFAYDSSEGNFLSRGNLLRYRLGRLNNRTRQKSALNLRVNNLHEAEHVGRNHSDARMEKDIGQAPPARQLNRSASPASRLRQIG